MAGPASTVAFVIARSPARGLEGTGRTRRPARGGRLLGAPTPWRDRNTSGTLPRRRSRRRRFAGSWDPASVTSTRRATSTWVPTATGPESAGPAPPAPRSSFKNSGEVTTSTTASQYRRATQGPDGGSHAHGPTITTVSGQSLRDGPTAPRSCRAAAACSRSGRRRRGPGQAATDPVDRRGPRAARASRTALAVAAGLAAACRPRADGSIKCGSIHNYGLTPLAGTARSSSVRRGTATPLARLCRQARPTGRDRKQKYVATEPTIRNATDVPRQHRP